MARWQLTEPHYLNVPGTMWEQVTTDRVTQRPVRKQFPVPMFLDPRIQTDWNYNIDGGRPRKDDMDGQIIIAYAGKGLPNDIIFEGPPSPGMLPLDDEARAISGQYSWTPTQDVTEEAQRASNQAKILDGLIQRLADANVAPVGGAVPPGFEKLMESMAAMMQQQTQLLAMLLQKQQLGEFEKQAREAGAEAAVDEEPLPEADAPTAEDIETSAKQSAENERIASEKANAALARASRRA